MPDTDRTNRVSYRHECTASTEKKQPRESQVTRTELSCGKRYSLSGRAPSALGLAEGYEVAFATPGGSCTPGGSAIGAERLPAEPLL